MRLRLICEIFDELSMDGVEVVRESMFNSDFKFRDPRFEDIEYIVNIYREPEEPENDFEDYVVKTFGSEFSYYRNKLVTDSLYLKTNQHGFSFTKAGNPVFVYTKLLACIKYFWSKAGRPMFLSFSGSHSAMDVVYSRLLNRAAKLDDTFRFVPYNDELFIRGDILDGAPAEFGAQSKVAKAEKEYASYIDSVKRGKKSRRVFNPTDPSTWAQS